jgi:hypothetical protein
MGALLEPVEADHRDVVGHADPARVGGAQDPERHLVVGDEDRIGRRSALEDGVERGDAALRRPGAHGDRARLETGGLDRCMPAIPPIPGLAPGSRAGHVRDVSPSEAEQMAGRELRAPEVVDHDRREGGRCLRLEEDHRRRGARELVADRRDVGADLRDGEDDALDAVGDHELHDGRDVDALRAVDLLEQQAVAGGLGFLGDPVERLRHAEVAQSGHDHAEGLRPPVDEAASHGARLEPGLRDRRLDGPARPRRHVRALVDDPRDGLRGHPAHAGDLPDGDPAGILHVDLGSWLEGLASRRRTCYGNTAP